MLPDLMYMPAEEILYLKREELMRDFQEIRLVAAARQSNPGLAERLRLWIAGLVGTRERLTAPRQTHIDSAIRLAA